MSVNLCFREHPLQHANQHRHTLALLLRTGVLRLSVSRETSHVAHPDAHPVMPLAMGTDTLNAASHLYPSIRTYHKVIADASEALRLMPTVDILSREILTLTSGRAMNDNLSNPSHIYYLLFISYYLVFSSYYLVGCELLGRSQLISNK